MADKAVKPIPEGFRSVNPYLCVDDAARAIDLMDHLGLPFPRTRFLEMLSEARSNRLEMGNGADIYRRLVETVNPSYQSAGILI